VNGVTMWCGVDHCCHQVVSIVLVADSESQCSVCMEDFHLGDVVRSLPCQHLFHTDCINPWLHLVEMLCVMFTCLECFDTDGHISEVSWAPGPEDVEGP